MTRLFLLLPVCIVIVSCNGKGDKQQLQGRKVARVYDQYLFESDLKGVVPEGTAKDDSLKIVKSYIDDWVRQHLVTRKAELNLDDAQKDVDELLENYRRDLIRYIYKRELIKQKLDTVITNEEITSYYEANKSNFELKENIVQVVYAKFEKNAPGLDNIRRWYRSDKEEDVLKYRDHCHKYATSFFMNDTIWLPVSSLLNEVPVEENSLAKGRFVETGDSLFNYFVAVRDIKTKESISPLSYEKNNIRDIILNKRKVQLVQAMEDNLYKEAFRKNNFDIYE